MSNYQLSRKALAAIGLFLKDKLKEGIDLFDTANGLAEVIEGEISLPPAGVINRTPSPDSPAVEIKPMTAAEKEEDKKKNSASVTERPGGPPKANKNIGGIRDETGKPISPPFGHSA